MNEEGGQEVKEDATKRYFREPFIVGDGMSACLLVPRFSYDHTGKIDPRRSAVSSYFVNGREGIAPVPKGLCIGSGGFSVNQDLCEGIPVRAIRRCEGSHANPLRGGEWGYVRMEKDGDQCRITQSMDSSQRAIRRNEYFVDYYAGSGMQEAIEKGKIRRMSGNRVFRDGSPADGVSFLFEGTFFLVRNNNEGSNPRDLITLHSLDSVQTGIQQQPPENEPSHRSDEGSREKELLDKDVHRKSDRANTSQPLQERSEENPRTGMHPVTKTEDQKEHTHPNERERKRMEYGYHIIGNRGKEYGDERGQDRVFSHDFSNGARVLMVNDGAGEKGNAYTQHVGKLLADLIERKFTSHTIDTCTPKDLIAISHEIQKNIEQKRSELGHGLSTCDALFVLPGGRKLVLHVGEGNSKTFQSVEEVGTVTRTELRHQDFRPHQYGEGRRDGFGSKAKAFGAAQITPEAREIAQGSITILGSDGLWEGIDFQGGDFDIHLFTSLLREKRYPQAARLLAESSQRGWEEEEKRCIQQGKRWVGKDDVSVCIAG